MRLLAEFDSQAMHVQIMERKADGARLFLEGGMQHTAVDRDGIAQFAYVHAMAEAFRPARNALLLGLGGGSLATLLARSGMDVCAVDILPEAFSVAKRWFFMPETVRCVTADAVAFVAEATENWDAISVDAYRDGVIPDHLLTEGFVAALALRLSSRGMIAWNVAMEQEGFGLVQRVTGLLVGAGLDVSVLAGCPAHVGNAIVFAGHALPSTITFKGAPRRARKQMQGATLLDAEVTLKSETPCALCQDVTPLFDASDPERSSNWSAEEHGRS